MQGSPWRGFRVLPVSKSCQRPARLEDAGADLHQGLRRRARRDRSGNRGRPSSIWRRMKGMQVATSCGVGVPVARRAPGDDVARYRRWSGRARSRRACGRAIGRAPDEGLCPCRSSSRSRRLADEHDPRARHCRRPEDSDFAESLSPQPCETGEMSRRHGGGGGGGDRSRQPRARYVRRRRLPADRGWRGLRVTRERAAAGGRSPRMARGCCRRARASIPAARGARLRARASPAHSAKRSIGGALVQRHVDAGRGIEFGAMPSKPPADPEPCAIQPPAGTPARDVLRRPVIGVFGGGGKVGEMLI